MEIKQIAEELVSLVREGKNKEAKEKFYSADIISIEGNGDKVEGIAAVYEKSNAWMSQIAEVHSASVTDPLVAADHFAIGIKMDITYKNGYRAVLDEIGVYDVNDGKIVAEQFFFKS
ncbi:SnoaL-like domain-containing protein [Mucilaginibacter polytrichastri]|uniref:SnoaL-like domain-containing protein n=1 Tax=Mucilaginibacter polytrichastri TaxID=1302689 RepID=A0A1Q6A416_9SPHI|nr:SnoaL-like domain-containing protein [Mucilaginibacter polytrichastri]OKS88754.1 hypothetical protein RG47T_4232 [Mucilaginibacter polytrichastri]SFT05266.1 hypothetical protein SAMN04487890_10987 [Mucilaginibacter polytrichastri]